ncbi:hypothetical protein BGX21_006604 [Mortierella sp. AD011]|nr:hypothetical protein BGX21_006604 [Mortierella sp. AD011]
MVYAITIENLFCLKKVYVFIIADFIFINLYDSIIVICRKDIGGRVITFRFSFNWWKEWTIIMGVFAVTGSSTVMVVKPVLKEVFKLDGSMKEGPWSFRIAYLSTTLPLYSCILLTVATIAGRRPYFQKVVLRMWGRFLPKKVIQRFQ